MSRRQVLLDENIPRKLKFRLSSNVDVATVTERGWNGIKNGELLSRAQLEFSVFITMDRGLPHQQNLIGYEIGILLLNASSNKYIDLLPLIDEINQQVELIGQGEVVHIYSKSL